MGNFKLEMKLVNNLYYIPQLYLDKIIDTGYDDFVLSKQITGLVAKGLSQKVAQLRSIRSVLADYYYGISTVYIKRKGSEKDT